MVQIIKSPRTIKTERFAYGTRVSSMGKMDSTI